MARRTNGLGNSKSKSPVVSKVRQEPLDYHEGLSANQVKIILLEFGFNHRALERFNDWMFGQTCPVIQRWDRRTGKYIQVGGVYEYDLFRWIENQKKGTPLVWD